MGSHFEEVPVMAAQPFRVLVVGGCYAGVSAALNLQDLCSGRAPRCGRSGEGEDLTPKTQNIAIDITIVDERDGFCEANALV
jgi:hypothetical protein